MKVLVIVDMQRDFIDGALGSKEAVAIFPNVVKKLEEFDGRVFFTMDTHPASYLETQEGKHLPIPHCIKGSEGWKLPEKLEELQKDVGGKVFEKPVFGSVSLAEELTKLSETEHVESVELVGLCTDICVVSNALLIKAFLPEVPVKVDAACCAGVTPQKHMAALETMKSCQIEIINEK